MKAPYNVKAVARADCAQFILDIHYAKRWPSISYAFGLFKDVRLVGVVTYGTPFSSTLRRGIAGPDNASSVLELNRLCLLENNKNEASMLVGRSLRLLPRGKIIVSSADTSQGHVGTVYQAANFLYCGLSAKRTDWKIKGREHLHGQTISDEFRGVKNRAQAARVKYGDDFYLAPRPRKHRYVFVTGGAKFKANIKSQIRYPITPAPTQRPTL